LDAFDDVSLGLALGAGFSGALPNHVIKLFCFGASPEGLEDLGGMRMKQTQILRVVGFYLLHTALTKRRAL
jgi:hypothetical protein